MEINDLEYWKEQTKNKKLGLLKEKISAREKYKKFGENIGMIFINMN